MGIIIGIIIIAGIILIINITMVPRKSYAQTQREAAERLNLVDKVPTAEELMADAEEMGQKMELLIQSEIMGDQATHDAVINKTYNGPLPEKRADGAYLSLYDDLRILSIKGINHRKNIANYCGRLDCALVPDPTNEFDPDAIKIVAEDGHHLGFIDAMQTDFVRSLTGEHFPYRCKGVITECEDDYDGHTFYVGRVYIKRLKE